MRMRKAVALFAWLALMATFVHAQEPDAEEDLSLDAPQQRGGRGAGGDGLVFKDRITPHWFAENARFWYRNDLPKGAKEFILVNAEKGSREAAFDHVKLAASLTKASGTEAKADMLPFSTIDFPGDSIAVCFKVGDQSWKCDLVNYECTKTDAGPAAESEAAVPENPQRRGRGEGDFAGRDRLKSPDGKWTAFLKDHDVLRPIRIRRQGSPPSATTARRASSYARLAWSPDSQRLVAFRVEPGDRQGSLPRPVVAQPEAAGPSSRVAPTPCPATSSPATS